MTKGRIPPGSNPQGEAMLTVKQVLAGAADYIEQHGLNQNGKYFHYDKACAIGAMMRVANPHHPTSWLVSTGANHDLVVVRARHVLSNYVAAEDDYVRVSAWNDNPSRTKEEVVAALRAAANSVEE